MRHVLLRFATATDADCNTRRLETSPQAYEQQEKIKRKGKLQRKISRERALHSEPMSPSGDPLIEFHSGAAHPSSSANISALPPGSRKLEWLAVVIAAFVF